VKEDTGDVQQPVSAMSESKPTKYRTTNWHDYNASLVSRGSMMIWIDRSMHWLSTSGNGKRGRDVTFSDAAIQFCLMIKALYNLPLRQSMGLVQGLLKLGGLNWPAPDYSTLSRRQRTLPVAIPQRSLGNALHLLVDSTGLKIMGEGEWKRKKHGAEYRRQWRKVHLAIDEETLEIRAVSVTASNVGDAPMLQELLEQIPTNQGIASVSGDGAYDTKGCHNAIALRQAQAVIPVRRNGQPWRRGPAGACARNEILRATKRLGRSVWKKWSGYHRRSLVETKMRCLKLLGERITSKTFERQVTEVRIRVALLNRFTHLGTPRTVPVA
jgi:hypothetical protein